MKQERRRNGKRRRYTALAFLLLLLCAASPVSAAESLTIGVRDDIMHMSYLNPNTGKYYGLEIDLAKELSERLGYGEPEFVTVTPATRKEMLLNGEVDCIIAVYSVETSREENFDFTDPYYTDSSVVMVESSSLITKLEDLVGKTTGALDGANTAPKLYNKMLDEGLLTEDDLKGSSIKQLETYAELSEALEDGSVDAVAMDGCIANAYMEDDRLILEETIGQEEYAVATQKDSELSEKMAAAVQEVLEDGTMDQLIAKWE